MRSFIAKQPNGLYCRFSGFDNCPNRWNMTRESYFGTVLASKTDEEILGKYLQPFSEVIERFVPNNMTQKEFNSLVEEMSK